jgi:hypothetical protein
MTWSPREGAAVYISNSIQQMDNVSARARPSAFGLLFFAFAFDLDRGMEGEIDRLSRDHI